MSSTKIRATAQITWDADIDFNAKKLKNLAEPTLSSDACTKNYADAIADNINAFQMKGLIDASSNPNYPAASAGHTYRISVAGKVGGASGKTVAQYDIIECLVDSSAAGDEATVGTNWNKISYNGGTGTVSSTSSGVVDNSIVRMDSTTGSIIQTSLVTIDDSGSINLPSGQAYKINGSALTADNIGDGTTNKAYTATEKTKLSGIDANALNKTSMLGNLVTRETPTGSLNGSNTTFTLAYTPVSGTEEVYLNGMLMDAGAGNDYTISGATITMLTAPISTDKIRVTYWK